MSIIVANWSDKQLDELLDLLKASDYSPLAAFIFENFLASGNRIMSDTSGSGGLGSTLRLSVNGTDGRAVDLSPGVLQVGGFVSHVSTTQTINILSTTIGQWGIGQAADATQGRWSLVCIKNTWRRTTPDARWFVDDSVEPNTYTQQMTNTEREMSYFNIQVIHGTPGQAIQDIIVPTGYWCIGEVWVPADPTFSLPVSSGNIYDTALISNDPVPHWTSTSRVLRLEFWSTLFSVDHDPATGFHRAGTWHIGATTVTANGNQINQALSGIAAPGGTVTAPNLTQLTDGSITTLHFHAPAVRFIYGNINEDGTIYSGTGFTVSHPGTGRYIITFTPPFSAVPSVTSSPGQQTGVGLGGWANLGNTIPGFPTVNNVEIQIRTYFSHGLFNCPFSFIAIGT